MCLASKDTLWFWQWWKIGTFALAHGGDGAIVMRHREWVALWRAVGDAIELADMGEPATTATWHYHYEPSTPDLVVTVELG